MRCSHFSRKQVLLWKQVLLAGELPKQHLPQPTTHSHRAVLQGRRVPGRKVLWRQEQQIPSVAGDPCSVATHPIAPDARRCGGATGDVEIEDDGSPTGMMPKLVSRHVPYGEKVIEQTSLLLPLERCHTAAPTSASQSDSPVDGHQRELPAVGREGD